MTTIAVKDNIIAFDSRSTAGDRIISNNMSKRRSHYGYNFFFAGSLIDIDKLIQLFFDEEAPVKKRKNGYLEATAYIVGPDRELYICGYEDDELIVFPIGDRSCDAIGSGAMYAIGAMDAGASAKEAVKIAAGRDIYTGGRIRTFEI